MTLAPILAAPPAIQIHLATMLLCAPLGAWILLRPKGTGLHKALGWLYVVLIMTSAISSFWIRTLDDGSFTPLHLLSVLVVVSMPYAVVMVRRGNVRAHRRNMAGVYVMGVMIAGAATLLPGRLLHAVAFGS